MMPRKEPLNMFRGPAVQGRTATAMDGGNAETAGSSISAIFNAIR